MLAEGEQATGAQVVVAIFPALEGESLEDFSIRLAERWRVGRKDLDDGAIVLVFLQDRKVRIEVGYGLEGAIPDIEASRIIRETIAPRFREGRYDAGLEAAARAIYAQVETTAPAERAGKPRSTFPFWGVVGFFAILAVIAVMLMREAAASRGVSRGYTAGRRGWGIPPVIFIPPVFGGRGHGGGGGGGGFGGFSGGGGGFGGGGASGDW